MMRHPDWYARLAAYVAQVEAQPFVPGRFDCALFAAGAVEAMTGVDLAAHWRGRYRSVRGGVRVLRAEGYADHVALAAAHFEAIPPAMAGIGDLGVVPSDTGHAMGVVLGSTVAVLRPEGGLGRVALSQLMGAFRV